MNRRIAQECVRLLEAHQTFVRATVVRTVGSVPGKLGACMVIRSDGSSIGTVGGAALEERVRELAQEAFRRRAGGLHHFDLQRWKSGGLPSLCGGSVDIAVEYEAARPALLLWGGGHVASAFAALLPSVEYDYSVADDRPEWTTLERFPGADRREVVSPEALWNRFDPSTFSHLYILGYDAAKDLEVLVVSLGRFSGYLGLIASAAKREHLFAALRSRGLADGQIARVHSPVGLAIGAETPAEIAVAMVAELIQQQHPVPGEEPVRAGAGAVAEVDGVPHPA